MSTCKQNAVHLQIALEWSLSSTYCKIPPHLLQRKVSGYTYGYRHTERFLAELAALGADAPLTEALAH